MKMTLSRDCPQCGKYAQATFSAGQAVVCPHCSKPWTPAVDPGKIFERCPVCQATQFYLQKDFNQALGCLVMLGGIVLVPFTMGLSLVVFAAVDWLLYKRVPSMIVCYKCHTEFRGFATPSHLKPFMHHIGVRYDQKASPF